MEDFILSLIDSIKETHKARNPIGILARRKESPEYYPNYNTYVEWRKAISLHTTKGIKPDRILAAKHPNMTDAEFEYSIANFKQTTLPLFFDYIATLGRGVQDNNVQKLKPLDLRSKGIQRRIYHSLQLACRLSLGFGLCYLLSEQMTQWGALRSGRLTFQQPDLRMVL